MAAVALGLGMLIQSPAVSGREAAVRFDLSHGVTITTPRSAVVWDPKFGVTHPKFARTSDAQRTNEGEAIARFLEKGRAGNADTLLRCVRSPCVPIEVDESVIVVNDPEVNGSGANVFLSVYAPSNNPKYDGFRTVAVVELVARSNGWEGVRFKLGPSTGPVVLAAK